VTDPQSFVADQIGQQAETIQGSPVSEQEIAQRAQASAGLGVTEADIGAILGRIKAMEAALAEAQRAAKPSSSLVGTVDTLQHHLTGHGDPKAIELGNDVAEAAKAATETGDTAHLAKTADKLARHLLRNRPYPGENYHYGHALDGAQAHVPDAIDAFVPPAVPGKVVEGAVVG